MAIYLKPNPDLLRLRLGPYRGTLIRDLPDKYLSKLLDGDSKEINPMEMNACRTEWERRKARGSI